MRGNDRLARVRMTVRAGRVNALALALGFAADVEARAKADREKYNCRRDRMLAGFIYYFNILFSIVS
jgi:hypothetical protein